MENNIIVKVRGGLGNQLFQYAYARTLQMHFPDKRILIDCSYFRKKHARNLEINKLLLSKNVLYLNHRYLLFDFLYLIYRLIVKINNNDIKLPEILINKGFLFCNRRIQKLNFNKIKSKNYYLAGYFQSEEYISDIKNEIKLGIKPKEKLSENIKNMILSIKSHHSVGISIRIGEDYVSYGWPICSKNYYQSGLQKILKTRKNCSIFIFSDNINKIKKEKWFEGHNVTFIEGYSSVESLYLLTLCDDFIIANSTFSWWGAYLGEYKDKIIYAPKSFYRKNGIMRTSGLHMNGTIYLDNYTGEIYH